MINPTPGSSSISLGFFLPLTDAKLKSGRVYFYLGSIRCCKSVGRVGCLRSLRHVNKVVRGDYLVQVCHRL